MENLKLIIRIIEFIAYIYLSIGAIYILIFSIAGKFKRKIHKSVLNKKQKFAVFIPAYKEDNIIIQTAKDALNQSYPKNFYDVIVIADSLKQSTIQELKKLPILLIEVSFEQSTKAKALNKAMEKITNQYDVALILDADNIMEPDFICKINDSINSNYQVVQGHRIAKNLNTNFAILDALSEEINNHIFRKGHRVLGLSSALIGSGMAFNYPLFKKMMKNVNAVGGFDKELELNLLKNKITIEYLEDALVYDEKISKAKAFTNQRKRWLSAQFVYFRRFFLSGIYHLFTHGNFDFFDKVYQMVSPPRILLLGLLSMAVFVRVILEMFFNGTVNSFLYFNTFQWGILWMITIAALILAIPKQYYNPKTFKALLSVPKAFFIMLLVLFKLKNANKKFIHTVHNSP